MTAVAVIEAKWLLEEGVVTEDELVTGEMLVSGCWRTPLLLRRGCYRGGDRY